jgi:YqaJ-like viral recombinase domain
MIEIVDCEQGTEAWFRARMGIPTASEFKTLLGIKKDAREKVTRRTYMLKLAGEILTGEPMESYSNGHMERGKIMEDEARSLYAFMHDIDPVRVGFVKNGQKGCSPDSLIGNDGMLEIKTALPHILAEIVLKDDFPPEHKAQCQGALWVAEREWIDITVYWPRMPRFVKRAYRDEPYIKELSAAVNQFNDELAAVVEDLRRRAEPTMKAVAA